MGKTFNLSNFPPQTANYWGVSSTPDVGQRMGATKYLFFFFSDRESKK